MNNTFDTMDPRLLFERLNDHTLSREEFAYLNDRLREDERFRELYFEHMTLTYGLKKFSNQMLNSAEVIANESDQESSREIWNEIIEFDRRSTQKTSPVHPGGDSGFARERPSRPSRKQTLEAIMKIAAVFVFAALLVFIEHRVSQYYTRKATGFEVATLSDAIDAQWAGEPVRIAERLKARHLPLILKKGVAEVQFDSQAKMVVEAPAEFQVIAEDQVKLAYGRIYMTVPQQAIGFAIKTEGAKIIDLGTEFGVHESRDGLTEVHVIKGKTNLVSFSKGNKINVPVTAGAGKRLNRFNGTVQDISCDREMFVRDINSGSDLVWKGQPFIDLADIVGNGNGLGTGVQGSYIETANGHWEPKSIIAIKGEYASQHSTGFNTIPDNPFIDGVFIPDPAKEYIQIDSLGAQYEGFPETTGTGWGGVIHVKQIMSTPIVLNGVRYGIPGKPAIFMHANAGITFELDRVREAYANITLRNFTALYGMPDCAARWEHGAVADFWVLVDGQVRFHEKGITAFNGGRLDIKLSDTDRFLTLVTTDGGKESLSWKNRTAYQDWCVFAEPRLHLE